MPPLQSDARGTMQTQTSTTAQAHLIDQAPVQAHLEGTLER